MPTLKPFDAPLTPSERRFADLLARCDALHRDLWRFAYDPRSRRVVMGLQTFCIRDAKNRSAFTDETFEALRSLVFTLKSFRQFIEGDFGGCTWFDATRASDDV